MTFIRIQFAVLLLFVGAEAKPQQAASEKLPTLQSQTYLFDALPTKQMGDVKMRPVFDGITTRGEHVSLHFSELVPGAEPRPPHTHPYEEIVIVREGELDVTINGKSTITLGPGGVAYIAANDAYGVHLARTTPAQYLVIALGDR